MSSYRPTIPAAITASHLEGLNHLELQQIRQAALPVASLADAGDAMDQIDADLQAVRRDVNSARVVYADNSDAPSNYSDSDRDEVRSRADSTLRDHEAEILKQLHIATTRARQIAQQTGAAASQLTVAGFSASTLDQVNRLLPSMQAQIEHATFEGIRRQSEAVQLRNDDAENLALATILEGVIADRPAPTDDAGQEARYQVTNHLTALRQKFRDPVMASHAERAARIAGDLDEIERDIITHREERSGNADRADSAISFR